MNAGCRNARLYACAARAACAVRASHACVLRDASGATAERFRRRMSAPTSCRSAAARWQGCLIPLTASSSRGSLGFSRVSHATAWMPYRGQGLPARLSGGGGDMHDAPVSIGGGIVLWSSDEFAFIRSARNTPPAAASCRRSATLTSQNSRAARRAGCTVA